MQATRSWEIDVPIGMRYDGKATRTAAARELKEEVGYQLDKTLLIGRVAVDSGPSPVLFLFAYKSPTPSENNPDYSEAISKKLVLFLKDCGIQQ